MILLGIALCAAIPFSQAVRAGEAATAARKTEPKVDRMTTAPKLFVTILTYVAPIEQIDAAGAEHVAWLQRGYDYGIFLASGRRVPRTGGIILARAASIDQVEAWMRQDPYQARGLATAEIYPFEGNMMSEAMRAAVRAGASSSDGQ